MAGRGLQSRRKPGAAVETPYRMQLGGRWVDLVLRQSARRSFALQVDHRGARVAVPHGTAIEAVERFVRGHAGWLIDRLDARAARPSATALALDDGSEFPLFGRPALLALRAGVRRGEWCWDGSGREVLCLPAGPKPVLHFERALRERALAWFRGRVEEYCYRLALPVPVVRLTAARTRWGSCSLASGIRLHWRLVHLAPELIDYVVAHEVAHLVEMNHSPRFWTVVETLYPDWRTARGRLREAGAGLPLLASAGLPQLQREE